MEISHIEPKIVRCFLSGGPNNHLQPLSLFLYSKETNFQSCHLQSNLHSYKTAESDSIHFCIYSK